MSEKSKIIRISTVAVSMNIILKGQLSWMNKFYHIIGVTGKDSKHFPEIEQREGIRMINIPMARTISPFQDLVSLWRLINFFKKEKPDIVHTHTPKAGLLGMIAASIAAVPIRLHTVGGIPWMETDGIKRILLKNMERLTYRLAHCVFPNSKGLEVFIIKEKLVTGAKLQVLGNGSSNGINTDFYRPDFDPGCREKMRESLGFSDEDIILGFVGRVAREKGIGEWLESFEKLRSSYPVKIVLVGLFERDHGGLRLELEEKIMHDPDIHFLGRFDDIRPYYAMMDIFVFPSYREGFPNALMEACAMGLPVIASDINGCNEIIENGKNGILVPVKSSEALYFALEKLINDISLRHNFGLAARKSVEENLKREVVWNALKGVYDEVLNEVSKTKRKHRTGS